MTYTRNIPQANQLVSVSQQFIQDNFNGADDSFGIDHYQFSNTTPNNGFHDKVTTPPSSVHPDATTNSILYSYQDIASVGPIQYSKGKTRVDQGNQVSTPLTSIQSSQTEIVMSNGAFINILDFSGITRAFGRLIVGNFSSSGAGRFINSADFFYVQSAPAFKILLLGSNTSNLSIGSSTTFLQVGNGTGSTLHNVFWTLEFLRIEI